MTRSPAGGCLSSARRCGDHPEPVDGRVELDHCPRRAGPSVWCEDVAAAVAVPGALEVANTVALEPSELTRPPMSSSGGGWDDHALVRSPAGEMLRRLALGGRPVSRSVSRPPTVA
jgi:hypothetical protein